MGYSSQRLLPPDTAYVKGFYPLIQPMSRATSPCRCLSVQVSYKLGANYIYIVGRSPGRVLNMGVKGACPLIQPISRATSPCRSLSVQVSYKFGPNYIYILGGGPGRPVNRLVKGSAPWYSLCQGLLPPDALIYIGGFDLDHLNALISYPSRYYYIIQKSNLPLFLFLIFI
jgi:hypothetical protein